MTDTPESATRATAATDGLRAEVVGNRVNGYTVEVYDGDQWLYRKSPLDPYAHAFYSLRKARRTAKRVLKRERKKRVTRHREVWT